MWGKGSKTERQGQRPDIIPKTDRENRDSTQHSSLKHTFYDTIRRELQEMQQEIVSDRIQTHSCNSKDSSLAPEVLCLRSEVQRLREVVERQRAEMLTMEEAFIQREESLKHENARLKSELLRERRAKESCRRLSFQALSSASLPRRDLTPITVTQRPFPWPHSHS